MVFLGITLDLHQQTCAQKLAYIYLGIQACLYGVTSIHSAICIFLIMNETVIHIAVYKHLYA